MTHIRMTRRTMMVQGAALLGVAGLPLSAMGQADSGTMDAATTHGPIRGKTEDGIAKFLGVPYGAPPVGSLRFRAPQPPQNWTEVRDTMTFGNPVWPNTSTSLEWAARKSRSSLAPNGYSMSRRGHVLCSAGQTSLRWKS
ncbi:carboxylesterase family protein [Devosia sp.]|uniref:carboxylesterase family protein n=1 Tax=Devosia sp. TaxID=1871048 RepID=UPI003263A993